jgi:hypothetical protein
MATLRIERAFISCSDYIKINTSSFNLNSIHEKYAFPDTGLGKFCFLTHFQAYRNLGRENKKIRVVLIDSKTK